MASIHPFRGVRPDNAQARAVIAPPYDVLSTEEASTIAKSEPRSFIRVTRSEVDLPHGADSHGAEAYEQAGRRLREMLSEGLLVQDDVPAFYLYVQSWNGQTQHGLMALCETDEYDRGLIKKHELTRPDKEQDRTDHIERLGAQTGLVFLTYRSTGNEIASILRALAQKTPDWAVETEDGVTHRLTVIDDKQDIAQLQSAFAGVDSLYIADGHHRSAAASRVAKLRQGRGSSGKFITGIFPDDELQVLAYNRLVSDLNGHDKNTIFSRIEEQFLLSKTNTPEPEQRGVWTMYLDGQWYRLTAKKGVTPNDVVGALDVSVLQDNVLGPLFGIDDPRTNKRIRFVGGIRGHQALSSAVDNGDAAVAFHLYPTGIDQLLAVADADRLMPPKSTWFEPKLRGGVLIHKLED